MEGKGKTTAIDNVKEIPLSDILSEEALDKQDVFARFLASIFVKYKIDSDLQKVFRESFGEISRTIAEECFMFGYDKGYVAGHKDGKVAGQKEARKQAEHDAAIQLQSRLEEELVRELLLNIAPGGRLQ
ncbi:hypothetical protein [uncultured Anaerovibrio sp.]|uniref:hypothetical protein n=1 Tax=uncultured Anaerovibrio sp. TaxID=361586 RepID=UPI00261471AF|nr:hypothetical protein [uncultured Anaerovibrio sp.]